MNKKLLSLYGLKWNPFSPDLPTMTASVGGFTRLWLGVKPAFGLELAGDLSGDEHLIERLSRDYVLPQPHPDWPF